MSMIIIKSWSLKLIVTSKYFICDIARAKFVSFIKSCVGFIFQDSFKVIHITETIDHSPIGH